MTEEEDEWEWVTPWPKGWNFGSLEPWEDWLWDHLPPGPEFLLYLRDSETDAQSTITQMPQSP